MFRSKCYCTVVDETYSLSIFTFQILKQFLAERSKTLESKQVSCVTTAFFLQRRNHEYEKMQTELKSL